MRNMVFSCCPVMVWSQCNGDVWNKTSLDVADDQFLGATLAEPDSCICNVEPNIKAPLF